MAKANWLKVDPSQGSGNATVNVSSTAEHTGRVARTTILTWKAANVANIERTESDPIPYAPPMEIFGGKYYTEADQLYLCTRDSGTVLSHPLSALVGLYVELA